MQALCGSIVPPYRWVFNTCPVLPFIIRAWLTPYEPQQFASRLSMLSTIWHLLLEPDDGRIARIRSYLFARLLEMAHAGVDQFRALPAAQQAQFVFVK